MFSLWALGGLGAGVRARLAIGGSLDSALTALLWGGGVRLFVLHHVTYSINSICHVFGRRRFATADESRNVCWLSLLSFGESWHNNHHAFPTSARHGLGRWELDPSALVIRALAAVRARVGRRQREPRAPAQPARARSPHDGRAEVGDRVGHAPPGLPWQFGLRAVRSSPA